MSLSIGKELLGIPHYKRYIFKSVIDLFTRYVCVGIEFDFLCVIVFCARYFTHIYFKAAFHCKHTVVHHCLYACTEWLVTLYRVRVRNETHNLATRFKLFQMIFSQCSAKRSNSIEHSKYLKSYNVGSTLDNDIVV